MGRKSFNLVPRVSLLPGDGKKRDPGKEFENAFQGINSK